MSNRIITFVAFLSLAISLAALWVSSPLASSSNFRDKIMSVLKEDPIPLFETAVKGGEEHRKRAEAIEQTEQVKKIGKIWESLTAAHAPFSGLAQGTTIVSFYDYNCGYCRKAHDVVEQLIQDDPTIKVVYKPVALFMDPLIVRATLAAHKQGKFKEIHNALMRQDIDPSKDGVKNLAKKLGFDMPRFLQDLESEDVKKQAAENEVLRKQLKIMGTPTYIIEKTSVVPGHIELDEFKSLLKDIKAGKTKADNTAE